MIRQHFLILAFSASVAFHAQAQFFLGIRSSSYGGLTNVDYNPAIADNHFAVDVNLIGIAANVNNNYIGLSRSSILHPADFSDPNFQADHLNERLNGRPKYAFAGAQIQGPLSFMFSFGHKKNKNKNAVAFTWHTNFIFDADHVDQALARLAYYGVGPKADALTHFLGRQLNNTNLSVKSAIWNDYGITYSRVVYDKGANMIKAGGTTKLLQPLAGAYADGTNLNYKWTNYTTLSISNSYFNYAYSEGLVTSRGYSAQSIGPALSSYLSNVFAYKYASPSAAADLGAIYEWKPDGEVMRCADEDQRHDKDRYKIAVGFSVIDLGAMRFERGPYSENFIASIQDWNVANSKYPTGLQSIDDTIRTRFQSLASTKSHFTLWLPTRFNLYIDYNINHGFGVNASTMISPDMTVSHNMLHQVTLFTLTPKYDILWAGAYLPLSVDVMGNISLGATLRIGPLIIGTEDILGLFAKKYIYNADIHAALKITIPYLVKHDHSKTRLDKVTCFFRNS